MENASKALLIAGAILLVIAIIAIGVAIVSKTRGTISTAGNQIDAMAIQMHNEKYKKYESNGNEYDKTFEEIRELAREIISDNYENENNIDNIVYLTVVTNTKADGSGPTGAFYYMDNWTNKEQKLRHPTYDHNTTTIPNVYNSNDEHDYVINVNRYNNSSLYNVIMKTDERGYINDIWIRKITPVTVNQKIY